METGFSPVMLAMVPVYAVGILTLLLFVRKRRPAGSLGS